MFTIKGIADLIAKRKQNRELCSWNAESCLMGAQFGVPGTKGRQRTDRTAFLSSHRGIEPGFEPVLIQVWGGLSRRAVSKNGASAKRCLA
jgi:hypothetical protein